MRLRLALTTLLLSAAAPAWGQADDRELPQAFTRVIDCRSVSAEAERLACYDREVSALQAAEAARQLVVMDRQQVRKTRRSLFGLTLPSLGIFGDDAETVGDEAQLESTIRTAAQNPLGKWVIVLEDGARWIQVDTRELARFPKSGQTIAIRRAAMGSYLANIDGQTAIRVRRER